MQASESAAVGVVVAAVALVALASGAALAGDNVALFSFEPDEVEVDPGEEVTVDVVMASHGGYGGEGVANVSFAVDHDPEVLSVTDVEAGPWLEGDDAEVVVEREIDEGAGEAWLNQSREPAGEGATGTEVIATVTLEVSEDAEATNATLTLTGRSVTLVDATPQSTMVRDAVVVVDGGVQGEEEADDADDPEGVTLADDADDGGSDADAGGGDDAEVGGDGAEGSDADDELPLALLATVGAIAVVAVVGLGAVALRRRDPGV